MTSKLIRTLQALSLCGMLGLATDTVADSVESNQTFIKEQLAKDQLLQRLKAPLTIGSNAQSFDQDWVRQLAEKQQSALEGQGPRRETPEVMYFVSSSIPTEGMRQILRDADRLGIPAAMRGLINNDFRSTAAYIMELAQPDNKGGVQVDPTLFKQFDIKAVPALVVTCSAGYDRITGNVKLERGLRIIAEDGDCKEEARRFMESRL
jgi:conjugal transfer pilus assembly protein TrbC